MKWDPAVARIIAVWGLPEGNEGRVAPAEVWQLGTTGIEASWEKAERSMSASQTVSVAVSWLHQQSDRRRRG